MRKFLNKNFVFLLPIIILFGFKELFYSTDKGDLIRSGYIIDTHVYDASDIFKEEYQEQINYTDLSEINLDIQNKFTVLVIGDSFSEQDSFGYKNYVAKNESISLVYFDKFLHEKNNPIQTLQSILNGDLLDNLKVDYIIVQSVERLIVKRAIIIDRKKILFKNYLKNKIIQNKNRVIENKKDKLFSNATVEFPLYNIKYLFDDNAYKSKAYKVKISKNLFSIDNNELLFYSQDLDNISLNSDLNSVSILNDELNTLSHALKNKGIKLIVLPSPDKYDIYYGYIVNKTKYPKPIFFEHFNSMEKNYLYVDSKKILSNAVKIKKDIYYYDDSHWTPYASRLISDELTKIINKK